MANSASQYFITLIFAAILLALPSCGDSSETGDRSTAIPDSSGAKADWEQNMVNFGRLHCDLSLIDSTSLWEGGVWYYDGMRVYYQISDYTGDKSFEQCADYIWDVYGKYVIENNGNIPAWRVFPQGLAENFYRTQNSQARQAVLELARNSPYAQKGGGESFELSRETAYLIHSYMIAADLGQAQPELLKQAVKFALSHLQQWSNGTANYVKPFMVGLSCEALIHFYEVNPDPAIPAAIKKVADLIWRQAWNSSAQAFEYIVCTNPEVSVECQGPDALPASDLNLLIAPLYAWLNLQFPNSGYDKQADLIFNGGVNAAFLNGGKQFSQSYRWSFDYIKWRGL